MLTNTITARIPTFDFSSQREAAEKGIILLANGASSKPGEAPAAIAQTTQQVSATPETQAFTSTNADNPGSAQEAATAVANARASSDKGESDSSEAGKKRSTATTATKDAALTEDERRQVEQLRVRDRQVRSHEQAHLAAAGSLAKGGPSFTFQTGPDGQRYAIGGEVSIDTSPVSGNPEATLRKAQQVQRAALAPADPSNQDRQVAAQAASIAQQARTDITREARDDNKTTSNSKTEKSNTPNEVTETKNNQQRIDQAIEDVNSDSEPERLGQQLNVIA